MSWACLGTRVTDRAPPLLSEEIPGVCEAVCRDNSIPCSLSTSSQVPFTSLQSSQARAPTDRPSPVGFGATLLMSFQVVVLTAAALGDEYRAFPDEPQHGKLYPCLCLS